MAEVKVRHNRKTEIYDISSHSKVDTMAKYLEVYNQVKAEGRLIGWMPVDCSYTDGHRHLCLARVEAKKEA